MLEVRNLNVRVGGFELHDVSMSLPQGTYGVLMGRTGSGKTTLLEAICGLTPVVSGTIRLDGVDRTHAKPAVRGIGYVPQDGALFATMTVREQIGFPLRIRGVPPPDIRERVEDLSAMLRIRDLLDRGPVGLSGGERQRVALGRALAFRPSILLMDEPLSAVDEDTREDMYRLLLEVKKQAGVTVLHVTHNSAEAARLGDAVFRLLDGYLLTAEDLPSLGRGRRPSG